MQTIKIAIVGVGNCSSALVQGLSYYRDKSPEAAIGLMHWEMGGYTPLDIEVVVDRLVIKEGVRERLAETFHGSRKQRLVVEQGWGGRHGGQSVCWSSGVAVCSPTASRSALSFKPPSVNTYCCLEEVGLSGTVIRSTPPCSSGSRCCALKCGRCL